MQIEFTKEQYENLIKLVYLGNWMINAIRIGTKDDPKIEKYDKIEQHIFSFAKEADLGKYIEYDEKHKMFFPTREFEESSELEQYREDYDNEILWQELADRLGSRDFLKQYGAETIKKMSQKERFMKEQEFIIKYEEEFAKNGLNNLEIIKK